MDKRGKCLSITDEEIGVQSMPNGHPVQPEMNDSSSNNLSSVQHMQIPHTGLLQIDSNSKSSSCFPAVPRNTVTSVTKSFVSNVYLYHTMFFYAIILFKCAIVIDREQKRFSNNDEKYDIQEMEWVTSADSMTSPVNRKHALSPMTAKSIDYDDILDDANIIQYNDNFATSAFDEHLIIDNHPTVDSYSIPHARPSTQKTSDLQTIPDVNIIELALSNDVHMNTIANAIPITDEMLSVSDIFSIGSGSYSTGRTGSGSELVHNPSATIDRDLIRNKQQNVDIAKAQSIRGFKLFPKLLCMLIEFGLVFEDDIDRRQTRSMIRAEQQRIHAEHKKKEIFLARKKAILKNVAAETAKSKKQNSLDIQGRNGRSGSGGILRTISHVSSDLFRFARFRHQRNSGDDMKIKHSFISSKLQKEYAENERTLERKESCEANEIIIQNTNQMKKFEKRKPKNGRKRSRSHPRKIVKFSDDEKVENKINKRSVHFSENLEHSSLDGDVERVSMKDGNFDVRVLIGRSPHQKIGFI